MIGSKTLKPGAGVKMEMIGDKTRGGDVRASSTDILKRCPFCGGCPEFVTDYEGRWIVMCHNCLCRTPGIGGDITPDEKIAEARKRWERRATMNG